MIKQQEVESSSNLLALMGHLAAVLSLRQRHVEEKLQSHVYGHSGKNGQRVASPVAKVDKQGLDVQHQRLIQVERVAMVIHWKLNDVLLTLVHE